MKLSAFAARVSSSSSRGVTALVMAALVFVAAPRVARADVLTWTLTGSAGFGYEVHPKRHEQAENIMVTGGLGILYDRLRFELGAVGAYGALWAHGPRHAQFELRPMVRINPPLLPLYARVIFAGLFPYVDRANVAYGGALGINIPLWRVGLMAEVGTLPRRVQQVTHWIMEARLGVSVRL